MPQYEWSPGNATVENYARLLSEAKWSAGAIAAQPTWLSQLRSFGTAYFTEHEQAGFKEAEEAGAGDGAGVGAGTGVVAGSGLSRSGTSGTTLARSR